MDYNHWDWFRKWKRGNLCRKIRKLFSDGGKGEV